jgi:hypothetical protein
MLPVQSGAQHISLRFITSRGVCWGVCVNLWIRVQNGGSAQSCWQMSSDRAKRPTIGCPNGSVALASWVQARPLQLGQYSFAPVEELGLCYRIVPHVVGDFPFAVALLFQNI